MIVVFAETDLRTAQGIARRLSSVMRHTAHGKREARSEPTVTLAALRPSDTAQSLLARLYDEARRAASELPTKRSVRVKVYASFY